MAGIQYVWKVPVKVMNRPPTWNVINRIQAINQNTFKMESNHFYWYFFTLLRLGNSLVDEIDVNWCRSTVVGGSSIKVHNIKCCSDPFHSQEGLFFPTVKLTMQSVSNHLKSLCFTGERGQCVLDTPPKILFCDLRLDPGESKTCMCGIYTCNI